MYTCVHHANERPILSIHPIDSSKKNMDFWSPLGDDDEAVSQKESIHSTIPSLFWEVKKFIGNPVSTCILEFRSFAMLSGHDVRLGLCARRSLGVHFAGPMSPTIGNDVTLTTSLLENCKVNHRYVVISCTNVTGMYREWLYFTQCIIPSFFLLGVVLGFWKKIFKKTSDRWIDRLIAILKIGRKRMWCVFVCLCAWYTVYVHVQNQITLRWQETWAISDRFAPETFCRRMTLGERHD